MTREYTDPNDSEITALFMEASSRMPELLTQRTALRKAGVELTAVLMPDRFDVKYVGKGADPDFKGAFLGLPIVFAKGEVWGVVAYSQNNGAPYHG